MLYSYIASTVPKPYLTSEGLKSLQNFATPLFTNKSLQTWKPGPHYTSSNTAFTDLHAGLMKNNYEFHCTNLPVMGLPIDKFPIATFMCNIM